MPQTGVIRGRLLWIAGTALPKGRAAIGWRIGVYWRDDAVFYAAEIIGFDTGTGRHQVLYDDGATDFSPCLQTLAIVMFHPRCVKHGLGFTPLLTCSSSPECNAIARISAQHLQQMLALRLIVSAIVATLSRCANVSSQCTHVSLHSNQALGF